jgi:hypothetical protein
MVLPVVESTVYLENFRLPKTKAPSKESKYESQPAFFGKHFVDNIRYKARLQYLPDDEYLCNGIADPDYNDVDDDAWFIPKLVDMEEQTEEQLQQQQVPQPQQRQELYRDYFHGPAPTVSSSIISKLLRADTDRDRERHLKEMSREQAMATQLVEDKLLLEALHEQHARNRLGQQDHHLHAVGDDSEGGPSYITNKIVIPPDGSPVVLLAKRGLCNFETKAKAALALLPADTVHYVIVYDDEPHKTLSPMSAAGGNSQEKDKQLGLLFVSLESGSDMVQKLREQPHRVTLAGGMVVYMDSVAPWMPPSIYDDVDGWLVVVITALMTVIMLCGCLIMCCQTGLIRREGNVLIFGQPLSNNPSMQQSEPSRLLSEAEVLSLEEICYTPEEDNDTEAGQAGTMPLLPDDRKMASTPTSSDTNQENGSPSALHDKQDISDFEVAATAMPNLEEDGNQNCNFNYNCNVPMCSVCLEEYEMGELLRQLPCKHTFHTECIVPWLTERSPLCPLCKSDVYQERFASEDSTREQDDGDDDDTQMMAPLPGVDDSTVSSSDDNDNIEALAASRRHRWNLFAWPTLLRRRPIAREPEPQDPEQASDAGDGDRDVQDDDEEHEHRNHDGGGEGDDEDFYSVAASSAATSSASASESSTPRMQETASTSTRPTNRSRLHDADQQQRLPLLLDEEYLGSDNAAAGRGETRSRAENTKRSGWFSSLLFANTNVNDGSASATSSLQHGHDDDEVEVVRVVRAASTEAGAAADRMESLRSPLLARDNNDSSLV